MSDGTEGNTYGDDLRTGAGFKKREHELYFSPLHPVMPRAVHAREKGFGGFADPSVMPPSPDVAQYQLLLASDHPE